MREKEKERERGEEIKRGREGDIEIERGRYIIDRVGGSRNERERERGGKGGRRIYNYILYKHAYPFK